MRRTMATMLLLGLALSAVQAQPVEPTEAQAAGPFPPMLWSIEEAQSAGWSRSEFDVGVPGLDHVVLLPPEAEIQTAPFEEAEWSGPGRLRNVAKIMIPSEFGEIDGTVTAFQTRATGSAVRLCAYLVAARGYKADIVDIADMRTRARFLSFALDEEDRPQSGMFTDCRTKGSDFLIHHFAFPLADVVDVAELDRRTDAILDTILPITSNLEFADGQPNGYGDAARSVELRLGSTTAIVPVPTPMQVEWNDFGEPGAAREIYLLQASDGPGVAVVWLGARDAPEKPDLAEDAPRLAAHQFQLQSQDVPESTLVLNEPIDPAGNHGVGGQVFRFDVTDPNGDAGGSIEGEAYWHDGRLFVVTWFTNFLQTGTTSSLIARLPSQTAFDLIRYSLLTEFRAE
jgi:hypothetical protein